MPRSQARSLKSSVLPDNSGSARNAPGPSQLKVRGAHSTEDLARVFPSLTELTIEHLDGAAPDLSALRRIAGLAIRVSNRVLTSTPTDTR